MSNITQALDSMVFDERNREDYPSRKRKTPKSTRSRDSGSGPSRYTEYDEVGLGGPGSRDLDF